MRRFLLDLASEALSACAVLAFFGVVIVCAACAIA